MTELPRITGLGGCCCGCGACSAVCPQDCIEMIPDSTGFSHPLVDPEICILCRKCEGVCPALREAEKVNPLETVWARSTKDNDLDRSSSGGLFPVLARQVLEEGGVVIGAAWCNGCSSAEHIIVEDLEDLDRVMRSKYVQSSVGTDAFESVRGVIKEGRKVLFSGTACQVAGMNAYLGHLSAEQNYLSLDVICHGVPSPILWKRWLDFQQDKTQKIIGEVNFRSKDTGWQSYSVRYDFAVAEDKETSVSISNVFSKDWYMRAFLQNASLRESCFDCPSKRRCGSDITLGDFWGIDDFHSDANQGDRGVSAVLINSEKGTKAFDSIKSQLVLGKSSLNEVLPGNPCLDHSVEPYAEYDAFMQGVKDGMTIPEMMRRWSFEPSFFQKVKGKIGRIIRG